MQISVVGVLRSPQSSPQGRSSVRPGRTVRGVLRLRRPLRVRYRAVRPSGLGHLSGRRHIDDVAPESLFASAARVNINMRDDQLYSQTSKAGQLVRFAR